MSGNGVHLKLYSTDGKTNTKNSQISWNVGWRDIMGDEMYDNNKKYKLKLLDYTNINNVGISGLSSSYSLTPITLLSQMNTNLSTLYNEGSFGGGGLMSNINLIDLVNYKTYSKALTFSGSNYVYNLPNITFGSNGFSVAFWFKSTFVSNFVRLITFYINDTYSYSILNYVPNYYIYVYQPNRGNDNVGITATTAINTNTWIHYCLTMNANNTFIQYRDGVQISSATGYYPLNLTTTNVMLGATYSTGSSYGGFYAGGLDDIRFYDRVLSATDVANVYNAQNIVINANYTTATTYSSYAVNVGGLRFENVGHNKGKVPLGLTNNLIPYVPSDDNTPTFSKPDETGVLTVDMVDISLNTIATTDVGNSTFLFEIDTI